MVAGAAVLALAAAGTAGATVTAGLTADGAEPVARAGCEPAEVKIMNRARG
jgi:hypothetical protein